MSQEAGIRDRRSARRVWSFALIAAVLVLVSPALHAQTPLMAGEVGVFYNGPSIIFASGNAVLPYTRCTLVSGTLPPGISFGLIGQFCYITGTPTSAGNFSFGVTVTDSANVTTTVGNYSIQVYAAISIGTTSFPNGRVGQAYSASVSVSGGLSPTVNVSGLPSGLSYSSGSISGTPGQSGTFQVGITASDSVGGFQSKTVPMTIIPILSLSCSGTSPTEVSLAYSITCTASGGVAPYSFSISAGAIPGGSLSPSGSSATISGAPTAAGGYTFTVRVTDSSAQSATQIITGPAIVAKPSITTGALNQAQAGMFFTQSLSASGGIGCCSWSIVSGGVGGVSLSSGGVLSGTPSAAGTFPITVKATDSNGIFATANLSLTVTAPVLSLSCSGTSPTEVSLAYSITCNASGGVAPYSFSISAGAIPGGSLSPSGSSATISGAPTAAGGYTFTVRVGDGSSQNATQIITGPAIVAKPSITTGSLNQAQAGVVFTQSLSASGGIGCCTWSIVSGGVSGISLSSSGVLSGTTASSGSFPITIRATDSNNISATANFFLTVAAAAFSISCDSSSGPAEVGQTYSVGCSASGGQPPYAWSASGSLPPGLSLSSTSGPSSGISGKTTTAGNFAYSIQCSDSQAHSQSMAFSANVAAGLTITTTSLPPAVVGAAYNQTLQKSGGVGGVTWSIGGGSLPGGITLSAGGTLSGTASAAGTFNFTAQATDSLGVSVTQGLALVVGANVLTAAPTQLTFSLQQGSAPVTASISIFATVNTNFTVSAGGGFVGVSGGGQTPGSVTVTITPGNLGPNTYNGSATFSANGASSVTVPITLTITAPPPTQLILTPTNINVTTPANSAPVTRQIGVSNPGSSPVSFSAVVIGNAPWLNLVTSFGTAQAGGAPAVVSFTLNPSGLQVGTYTATIQVNGNGVDPQFANITFLVSAQSLSIVLTQNGLQFTAVAGGLAPPAQTFAILNGGVGTLNWNVSADTLPSGAGWLKATPSTGSSTAGPGAITSVSVTVDPSKLSKGLYFGIITVTASGASNTPQQLTVSLNVLAPGQTPPTLAQPTGVIFTGDAGGADPPGASVSLTNVGTGSVSFVSTVSTDDGQPWLSRTPASAFVNPGSPTTLTLKASSAGLSAGIRRGAVRLAFSDSSILEISVAFVLSSTSPSGSADPGDKTGRDAGSGCDPATLTLNTQGSVHPNATLTTQLASDLQMLEVDCSKSNVDEIYVTAFFSYKDRGQETLDLKSVKNGQWIASWTPRPTTAPVSVEIRSFSQKGLTFRSGKETFSVNVAAPAAAIPQTNSVANNASYRTTQNVAPGSFISIFGDQLADAAEITKLVPFPSSLRNVQVTMGNLSLPLYYVSPTQINALVPFSLPPNALQSLRVTRDGTTPSTPISVSVVDSDPGIYTFNNSGSGQGSVLIPGPYVLAAPVGTAPGSRPVKRGEYIEIYSTGLGPVDRTPADGQPAPSAEPLARTTKTPKVTVGGADATVVYSGLAPGLIGLYQIDALIPANAQTGNAVPLFFTIGNATSNTVTIAVQ